MKKILKVALPAYVVSHCNEFFKTADCPLPHSQAAGMVRPVLEEDIGQEKVIHAPPSDRVIVHQESKNLEPIEN